jgi:hypothetical protein
MSIDECLTNPKKKPTLKTPPSQAWCRLRHAMQPARAQRIVSHPVHRSELHRIPYSAAHRANATSPLATHCVANNPRTDNQPATHRPQRPPRIVRLTAHTSHLQLCTRFAVLLGRVGAHDV